VLPCVRIWRLVIQSTWNVDVIQGAKRVHLALIDNSRADVQGEGELDVGADLVLDAAVAVLPLDAGGHAAKR